MHPALLFVALALLAGTAAAATYETTFTLRLEGEAPPVYDGPGGMARLVRADAGEAYAWELSLTEAYTVAEIRVRDVFDVERPRQIVPEYDDSAQHLESDHLHPHYFNEVPRDVGDADSPARILNYTTTREGDTVLRLGLTGPGEATLLLRADVTPPNFTVSAPTNVTTYSFLLRTTTDEFAFGDVRIRPAEGGDEVENPTAVPSIHQTFPVQGLDPDTEYVAYVRFWDWSMNEAASGEFRVRTIPEPDRPEPRIVSVHPPPNGTANATEALRVVVDANGTLSPSGVRVFLDLTEVVGGIEVAPDAVVPGRYVVSYPPTAALGPGRHRATVEVTNDEGGSASARWAWEVPGSAAPSVGLLALAAGASALAAARKRR